MNTQVIGQRYRGPGKLVFQCVGQDANGYWMQNLSNLADKRNVSVRAIGSTFHRVVS
jgi:hypothetical protein